MSDSSEFICEVVEVTDILPHPNAERLKIVKVRSGAGPLGYTLITSDHYETGELAVLVGVDSLVPVDRPEWEYCKKRLDYKPGSSHYRIRRAKLRGIATDGVLVRNTFCTALGTDVSTEMGILKYEIPESVDVVSVNTSDKGPQNPKALNWWKKNIPDYSVINLRKVSNLFTEGELVEISEKIHGSNIRFGKIRGKLYVGSHHAIKSDMRSRWSRFWDRLFRRTRSSAHWYGTDVWSTWVKENVDFSRLPEGYVFYGEIFGPGIQKGFEYGQTKHAVRIFDVWEIKDQRWVSNREKFLLNLGAGLTEVPTFKALYDHNRVTEVAELASDWPGTIREGLVVKSMDGQRRGKYVSDKYREIA